MVKVTPQVTERHPLASAIAPVAIDLLFIIANNPEAIAATRKILGIDETPAPVADDPNALISKETLAQKIECSTSTIDRLTKKGLPIAAHVGDHRRYRLADVEAWLKQTNRLFEVT